MNILFFIGSTVLPQSGGIKRVTDVLLREMGKQHSVYCLMVHNLIPDKDKPANHFYVPKPTDLHSKENIEFVGSVLREKKIDIIINQEGISPKVSAFMSKCKPEGIRLLTVYHNTLTAIYNFRTRIPLSISYKLSNSFLSVLDEIAFFYFRFKYGKYIQQTISNSERLVFLDSHLTDDIVRFWKKSIDSTKICAISNPITIDGDNTNLRKEKVLLFVGRLSKEKNVIDSLKVWRVLEKAFPEWKYIIVGDGPERHNIESFVRENGLNRVSLEGMQDPTPYYQQASVFLMTSLFEGLPLVLLEAMHFGVIPIACDTFPALKSLVTNGKNGFIIPLHDINAGVDALSKLFSNNSLRETLSEQAIAHSDNFSTKKILSEWNELFCELMSSPKL